VKNIYIEEIKEKKTWNKNNKVLDLSEISKGWKCEKYLLKNIYIKEF
jgi:hypothetical protein